MKNPTKAGLRLCDCGKHGRLISDDGYKGAEFCSKDEALYNLLTAQSYDRIRPDMVDGVMRQIQASDLPDLLDGADPEIRKKVDAFNHLRVHQIEVAEVDTYDPDRFHEHLAS